MRQVLPLSSIFVLLLSVGSVTHLQAQQLLRGPYLQIATPESITLRWRTDVECESVVAYGIDTNDLGLSVTNLPPTTEHEVTLTGLTPDTQYFYAVGSLSQVLAGGADCNFITSPPIGQPKPTRVWVLGDPGQSAGNDASNVRDAFTQFTGAHRPDVWLTLGDNGGDTGTEEEYQTFLFNVYPQMLRQVALWPTIGNHETYSVDYGARLPYLDIFSCPTNGEAGGVPSGIENYYSFDYANIHFICLDSSTDFLFRDPSGPMIPWLRADLEANTNQWVIAFWHHPPYSKGYHNSDSATDMMEMRNNIVPVLEEYGVDLVLCGHNHKYERSYLLHGHYGLSTELQPEMILDQGDGRERSTGAYVKPTAGPRADQGTVYIQTGCSGSVRTNRLARHPATCFEEYKLGSVVLDINSNRLDVVFLRDTGAVDDSFTLLKGELEPLRLLPLIFQDGNTIIRWKSIPGQTYRIERSESWMQPDWQPASEPITATGATTSWTNSTPTVGVTYFYRAVQLAAGQTGPTASIWTPEPISSWFAMRTTSEDAQSTPVQPASKRNAAAGKHPPAGVISDTLYWRRKIKANPQFAANKWRRMDPPHVRNLTTPHTSAPRYA